MRSRSATRFVGTRLVLTWLLLAAPSLPTAAEADQTTLRAVPPSATRIAVAGTSAIYRSYGLVPDPELYAPIGRVLEGIGARIAVSGREVEVRCGERTARWHVAEISSELGAGDRAFPTPGGEEPCVLRIRDTLYLPVRASAEVIDQAVVWDEATRTLHLVPQVRRVEVTEGAEGPRLRVESSGPIRATPMLLRNPLRLVVDLTPAVLQLPDGMPTARGAVKTIRAGQFTPMTARIVLEAEGRLTLSDLPSAPAGKFALALAFRPEASGSQVAASPPAEDGERAAPTTGSQEPRATSHEPRATSHEPRRRAQRLASRGGYFRRDPKLLDELLRSGQAALAGKVICLDPGHGGSDPGAHGVNGLLEKDACLAMVQEVARALREAGADVILTREEDRTVSLDERIDFANSQGCDLFISIHCNSMPHPNMASGTETYYYTPQSAELARAIHASVVGHVAGRDGGIRSRRFAVIRRTTMPSVLVEVAYINHEGDETKLADPEFRHGLGDAVRDGVIRYLAGG